VGTLFKLSPVSTPDSGHGRERNPLSATHAGKAQKIMQTDEINPSFEGRSIADHGPQVVFVREDGKQNDLGCWRTVRKKKKARKT